MGKNGDAVRKVFRILDVNLNRALEGLRVVEEICRFILEDKNTTLVIKKIRGELSKIIRISAHQMVEDQKIRISDYLIKSRRAEKDIGRKMYTKREGMRGNIQDIFRSNMKRAEEAVRVLEEFSKLLNPKMGQKFKAVRFKLYSVEKKVARLLVRNAASR
ncbi:thiamine-phosphate pyrophosphorylase [Candidatus Saganbacteria bacterium]|nr:thiamine-phosphate pyrophosphorylase [Candidatus Saganbacteria bacterium]